MKEYRLMTIEEHNEEHAECSPEECAMRYLLDYIAALEAVRDAAHEVFEYPAFLFDDAANVEINLDGGNEPIQEDLARLIRGLRNALAAAGQGETKNAPADT